ncbi:MAG TPA: type II toxin-antitoxin system PemK/MazF family toxin [Spirochaetia bacterium]|nr:type II toxin-antitoxin system PemK/MazF family toxin [Spirochaetia bacterium]
MSNAVAPGDILIVRLPSHIPKAHEQEGERPVVVGLPTGSVRYPVVVVVPLTTQVGTWASQDMGVFRGNPGGPTPDRYHIDAQA